MALIFINYRTNDARWAARATAARLVERFGQKNVFLDTKSIDLGDEFPSVIRENLQEAHVLLAVIGPQWLTAQSVDGLNINDPDDWVRREISEAIKTKKKIIPILVDNASLPRKKDLPPDLQPLADLHSLSISETGLDDGIKRLIQKLESLIDGQWKPPMSDNDRRLDLAARILAKELHRRWKKEMTTRESLRPRPLKVHWERTTLPVTVLPRADLDNDSSPCRTVPIPPSGTVEKLAAAFRTLQGQQLVVLGEAGSGKTVAAMMLTLDLLKSPASTEPVPVLVLMASWRPDVQHPYTWLANRLTEEFPFLKAPEYGPNAARELINTGRVMPVLDGLDEMPKALRPAAIKALDRETSDRPLVLTCRTSEYLDAVTANRHVLTSAVVVELEPVDLKDTEIFLTATAPTAALWRPVLTELQADPDAPLAHAMASPLTVSLACTVYKARETTPSELLDVDRFPDLEAVERHLLDELIPAVYEKYPRLNEDTQTRKIDPTPDQARHWLTTLACHLDRLGTSELAWWQLTHALSPPQAGTLAGVLGALTVGLTIAVPLAIASTPLNGLVFELTFGVFVGFAAGISMRPAISSPLERPKRLPTRATRVRLRMPSRAAGLGLLVGLAGALVFSAKRYDSGVTVVSAVVVGLVVLFLAILLFGLSFGLAAPIKPDREVGPAAVLRSDRRARLAVGLLALIIISIPFWRWISPALGLGGGLAVGIAYVSSGAYGRFSQARIWLAYRRRLPLRLMTFLADAHDREVLRQVGAVYQFRHRRLQERLAAQATTANRD